MDTSAVEAPEPIWATQGFYTLVYPGSVGYLWSCCDLYKFYFQWPNMYWSNLPMKGLPLLFTINLFNLCMCACMLMCTNADVLTPRQRCRDLTATFKSDFSPSTLVKKGSRKKWSLNICTKMYLEIIILRVILYSQKEINCMFSVICGWNLVNNLCTYVNKWICGHRRMWEKETTED